MVPVKLTQALVQLMLLFRCQSQRSRAEIFRPQLCSKETYRPGSFSVHRSMIRQLCATTCHSRGIVASLFIAPNQLFVAACLLPPRVAGATCARCVLSGAKTPCNRVRLPLDLGTKATSRAMTCTDALMSREAGCREWLPFVDRRNNAQIDFPASRQRQRFSILAKSFYALG